MKEALLAGPREQVGVRAEAATRAAGLPSWKATAHRREAHSPQVKTGTPTMFGAGATQLWMLSNAQDGPWGD